MTFHYIFTAFLIQYSKQKKLQPVRTHESAY